MDDLEAMAIAFAKACDKTGCRYALVGGMAVLAWGQPRYTSDIDTLLELDGSAAKALGEELARHGLTVDYRDFLDAREDAAHITVHKEGSEFRIDVKLAQTSTELAELDRAKHVKFDGQSVMFASPEDTLAFKLVFGTPQDLQDARSIWIRQAGRLDLDYLDALTHRLGVWSKLEALRTEPEPASA